MNRTERDRFHQCEKNNLMCPFPDDGQELDVFLGMPLQSSYCLPATGVVIRPFFAEKDLQVALATQKACLKLSEYMIGGTL